MRNNHNLFDKLGICGFCTIAVTLLVISYSIAKHPETLEEWVFSLNYYGIILEIIGVVVGAYTIREVFVGGFTTTGFTSSGFTTERKEIKFNSFAAAISILFILFGLWLQLLSFVFVSIDS